MGDNDRAHRHADPERDEEDEENPNDQEGGCETIHPGSGGGQAGAGRMEAAALGAAADEDAEAVIAGDGLAVEIVAAGDAEDIDFELGMALAWF